MFRIVLSLAFAVVLAATSAASAAHGVAHDRMDGTPHAAHQLDPHDHHSGGHDPVAALAECCDALGGKTGGSCLADAAFATVLPGDRVVGVRVHRIRATSSSLPTVTTPVPTGPPKV